MPAFTMPTIRPLQRADLERLEALVALRETPQPAAERCALMAWSAFSNPHARNTDLPTYFVAELRGELVGHFGAMPTRMIVDGEVRTALVPHDLFVSPEARTRGLGLFTAIGFYKRFDALTSSFFPLTFATEVNAELQRRAGYHDTGGAARYVKILDTSSKLAPRLSRVPLLGPSMAAGLGFALDRGLALGDAVVETAHRLELRVFRVDRFDGRFDDLEKRLMTRVGISTSKTSALLNFRFVDRPNSQKVAFAAARRDDVVGYIVIGKRWPNRDGVQTGIIYDLSADPDDVATISTLCAHAALHFRREDPVPVIECMATDPRLGRALKRAMFVEGRSQREGFLIGGLHTCRDDAERARVTDLCNWHFMYGDTDGFLFSP